MTTDDKQEISMHRVPLHEIGLELYRPTAVHYSHSIKHETPYEDDDVDVVRTDLAEVSSEESQH